MSRFSRSDNGIFSRYSDTLTNSSTLSVDVVGCVIERRDATDISTRKIASVWLLQLTVQFLQSVILKTC